jgi:carboxylesterase
LEILKGAEPFSYNSSSDIGILLIHGISGSPYEMAYWGEKLAKADFNVEAPRLTGNGTRWQDLNRMSYLDWIKDAETSLETLKKRASRVFIGGLSMGGALTLYLAENHPEIEGIIIINHALLLKNPLLIFLPVLKYFIPYTRKNNGNASRSIKDKSVNLVTYDRMPTGGVYELTKLVRIVKKDLSKIHQPALIFKSIEDSKLMGGMRNVEYTFNHISSARKNIVMLDNSYHIATRDFDKDIIVEKSIEFIKFNLSNRG